jgi:hypothetical protein
MSQTTKTEGDRGHASVEHQILNPGELNRFPEHAKKTTDFKQVEFAACLETSVTAFTTLWPSTRWAFVKRPPERSFLK